MLGELGSRRRINFEDFPVQPTKIMKTNKLSLTLSAVAVATLVAGCGDGKSTTSEKSPDAPSTGGGTGATATETVNQAVESTKAAATTVTEQAKTVATSAAADAAKQAESTTASMTAQAQVLIDKAKALVTDKKYQDALASLQQLTGFQLNAEQQKVVTDLKTTIQAALGSDAAKSVGGLLKK